MISQQNILFAGSSLFSLRPLEAIMGLGFKSVSVLTQPNKKQGRGLKQKTNPLMDLALDMGLEVFSYGSLKERNAEQDIMGISPDVLLTVSYGQIIPKEVLKLFSHDVLNIHPSLLPLWRGASPIQSAILHGDKTTGVSIMRMTPLLDEGPVFLSKKLHIDNRDNSKTLAEKLSTLAANILTTSLGKILEGKLKAKDQPHNEATVSEKIKKQDGKISWQKGAKIIDQQIRAYNPWPIAFTHIDGRYLRIWEAEVSTDKKNYNEPGAVIHCDHKGMVVSTGKGNLLIKTIQLEGKKAISGGDFGKGFSVLNKTLN
jgi:methionyl-tRNA formyltransferase